MRVRPTCSKFTLYWLDLYRKRVTRLGRAWAKKSSSSDNPSACPIYTQTDYQTSYRSFPKLPDGSFISSINRASVRVLKMTNLTSLCLYLPIKFIQRKSSTRKIFLEARVSRGALNQNKATTFSLATVLRVVTHHSYALSGKHGVTTLTTAVRETIKTILLINDYLEL